jgi:hypothetical protein
VAYEMLTGEKPFSAETTAGLLEMIRQGEGPDFGKVPPEAVPGLARAMARDPAMRPGSAVAFASELGQHSTLVMPIAVPDVRPAAAPPQFAGSPDAATVLLPSVDKHSRPVTAVARGPVATALGSSRRPMALAGGLALVVLIAAVAMTGDNPDADQGVRGEPTTTSARTTTLTRATSTTVTEITPASLAAVIGDVLADLDPPEFKPKDVNELEDRVNKAVDQWGKGQREMAAASLEDAFTSLEKLPESDAHDELFDLLTTLAEEMGFQVVSDEDG